MKKDEWKDGAERWIPVTERLPEPKVAVLCCIHYKDRRTGVNLGWYSAWNEQWYIGIAGIHATVTHWMPLPEPPEETDDAKPKRTEGEKAKQADHVSRFNKICPVCGFYVDAHLSLCPGCMARV